MKSLLFALAGIILIFLFEFIFIQKSFCLDNKNIYKFTIAISNEVENNKNEAVNKCQMKDHIWEIFFTVLGGLLSAGAGLLAGHVSAIRNKRIEKENRIRIFLATMAKIRHESVLVDLDKRPDFYKSILPFITQNAELIRNDFTHVSEGFDDCLVSIYKWDGPKIENHENQMNIIQCIDLFIGFVKNHKI